MKYLKWIAITILMLALLTVICIEGFYHYRLNQIDPVIEEIDMSNTEMALDVLWVSIGEKGTREIETTSATVYLWKIATESSIPDNKGIIASGLMARDYLLKNRNRYQGKGDWHLNNIVLSIWILDNNSADDILHYVLNDSNFGHGQIGLSQAADFYFAKEKDDLTLNENILLMGLLKGPTLFDPYCYSERANSRSIIVAENLKLFSDEKYANNDFVFPKLVERPEITCKSK